MSFEGVINANNVLYTRKLHTVMSYTFFLEAKLRHIGLKTKRQIFDVIVPTIIL